MLYGSTEGLLTGGSFASLTLLSSRHLQVCRPELFGNENRYILFTRRVILRPLSLTTEKDQTALFNGHCGDSLLDALRSPVIVGRNLTVRLSFTLPILCSQVDDSRELVGSA